MRSRVDEMDELRTPTPCEEYRYRQEARVVSRITIPDEVSGLVALRQWRLHPGMYLVSAFQQRRFASKVVWADEIPTAENHNGIYGWRPPLMFNQLECYPREAAIGLVEMNGHVVVHENGVLRAECCRILMLIAHSDFAARLSRIYGVPAIAEDSLRGVCERVRSWMYSHDGINLLKRNADLISDMQARKLLAQVDRLRVQTEEPAPVEEIPECLKDTGEVIQKNTIPRPSYAHPFTLIVRNAALQQRLSGGWIAFADMYGFRLNARIAVLQAAWPNLLNRPLTVMLDRRLSAQEDYVLIGPACCKATTSQFGIKDSTEEISLHADWLRSEIDWLNANVNGQYRWQREQRQGSSEAHLDV